ncbi:unnamed protein product [Closterium sp. NIES-54]
MSQDQLALTLDSDDAELNEGSSAIVIHEAGVPKTYAGYRTHKRQRLRELEGAKHTAPTRGPTSHDEQTFSPPAMEMDPASNAAPAVAPAVASTSANPAVPEQFNIPERFKGWTAVAVKGFRADFKSLLKAKSKLQKMKTLDEQGVLLHSIRTKAVEFQTKYPSVREKSAASVAAVHLENQKRIQKDFIASKEMEVEEILAASNLHVTTLATKLEDYLKSLSENPDLAVSDATREKYRKIKGACIEKAQSDIAIARDEIIIQELERQKKREAEDLKKAAAAEEIDRMELDPTVDAIVQKHVKKVEDRLRKEFAAKLDKELSAKLQKITLEKKVSPSTTAADSKPQNNKAKKKRGKKKKSVTPTDGKGKGQTAPKQAWVPKNGGGGPAKGPPKKK